MRARASSTAAVAASVATVASSARRVACRGGGLRGGQVVERGLRVLAPGGQVGLEVVGAGVEIGETGRELPHLGGAGAHLLPAAGQGTVAGIGRWRRRHRGARSGQHHADHERTEQRGSPPSHQTPSGRPSRRAGRGGSLPSGRRRCGQRAGRRTPVHPGEGRECPERAELPLDLLAVRAYC